MKSARWKKIAVVVADPFSDDQPALTKASAIAARCGARLTLLNTFMLPQPTPDTVLGLTRRNIEHSIGDRRRRLEKLAAKFAPNLRTETVVAWDYPLQDAIVRQVFENKPDVLITESHRHGRVARWVLANTDWELIRSCPCPLWFVRSAVLPKDPQLLVGVDPRHTHDKPAYFDDSLVSTAKGVTAQLGGRLAIAHAYEFPALPDAFFDVGQVPPSARKFVADTLQAVNRLGAKHGVGPKDRYVQEGDTSHVLSTLVAKRNVDLLLMGAVSRRSLQRPFIGNTAEKVIDHVDCDVFVIKPTGFKSPVPRRRPKL